MSAHGSPSPTDRIELDLDPRPSTPRRTAPPPVNQNPLFEMPKLYPVVDSSMLGSDQTQKTVAILILLNAVPGIIGFLSSHGNAGDLVSIPVSLILGIWMFSGSDFIRKLFLYYSILQLGIGVVYFALTMGSGLLVMTFMSFNILSIIGMIYLLSGDAISRKKYIFCIASILLGKAIYVLGAFA